MKYLFYASIIGSLTTLSAGERLFEVDEYFDSDAAIIEYLLTPESEREEIFQGAVREYQMATNFPKNKLRNYSAGLSIAEKKDIAEIVNTLADTATPKLLFERSRLDAIGARIDHVHPLNFLGYVFKDDELMVKMKNIKGKSLVWREFSAGIKDSMREEKRKNNFTDEQIVEFSNKIPIDSEILIPLAKRGRYEEILIALIENIKRNDDHDRYNL